MKTRTEILLNVAVSMICGFVGALIANGAVGGPAMATDKVDIVARTVYADHIVTDKIGLVDGKGGSTVLLPNHILLTRPSQIGVRQTSITPAEITVRLSESNGGSLTTLGEASLSAFDTQK